MRGGGGTIMSVTGAVTIIKCSVDCRSFLKRFKHPQKMARKNSEISSRLYTSTY
jgi:hypothetical protein